MRSQEQQSNPRYPLNHNACVFQRNVEGIGGGGAAHGRGLKFIHIHVFKHEVKTSSNISFNIKDANFA